MRTRTLSLKKETLADLTTEDLALVVGAQAITNVCGSDLVACIPTNRCFTGTETANDICHAG